MKQTIKVTQRCIANGYPGDEERCSVTLAFNEAGMDDVSVYEQTIMINGKEYPSPTIVKEFVRRFDDLCGDPTSGDGREELFKPFEFEMELPDPQGGPQ